MSRVDYAAGLFLGLANACRHRLQGYRTPRTFDGLVDFQRARAHARGVFDNWRRYVSFEGRRVIEIGPGEDLETGHLIMGEGKARSYLAVDCFELVRSPDLPYLLTEYPGMANVTGQFDLVVSNATLEHFGDVPALFRRLSELVPPDGEMVHLVDAKTHMRWIRDRDPLNLLRYPDWMYRMMSFPGIPNRLRAADYVSAATAAGFDASVHPERVADDVYLRGLRTARPHSYDDLKALSFTLVCRRSGSNALKD